MKQHLIPGLFLAGTIVFTYLYIFGEPPKKENHNIRYEASEGKLSYDKLRLLKKETEIKMEIQQNSANFRKKVPRPELDASYSKRNKFHDARLHNDLGYSRSNDGFDEPVSIDQQFDAFLAKRQEYEEMEEARKKMFVERFIEESRAMGYKVEVDENLQVKNVQRISE